MLNFLSFSTWYLHYLQDLISPSICAPDSTYTSIQLQFSHKDQNNFHEMQKFDKKNLIFILLDSTYGYNWSFRLDTNFLWQINYAMHLIRCLIFQFDSTNLLMKTIKFFVSSENKPVRGIAHDFNLVNLEKIPDVCKNE